MKFNEKIAIARIFSDLIKADRIIDIGEIRYWDCIWEKYAFDRDIEIQAQKISFADALNTVSRSGMSGLKADLLTDCQAMTVSDGFCAHSEALLMIALILMLDERQPSAIDTISIPRSSFNIDIATVLYVESGYDAPTNSAIATHYRSIFKELQLAGFHFIYLPNIIDHYRKTDPRIFKKILSFIAPYMSESGIDNTFSSLMQMTTGSFCKDLLCNKLGISELRDTYPSLLIKIGNSYVGETSYADYLKIEVDDHILDSVRKFVDTFCGMLSSDIYVVSTSEERDNQFHLHGFYKQLLDIFLIRKNIRSRIVIDPYTEEILYPDIDARLTGLHRREKVLYALLLCSGSQGINFTKPRSVAEKALYEKRMARVTARYQALYRLFGGDTAPDLTLHNIRGPIISRIKNAVSSLSGLYNPEDYNISKSRAGDYSVHIEPNLIYVRELTDSEPVPLHASDLYRRTLNSI